MSSCGKQYPATMATSWAASHMLTLLWQWRATGSNLWVHHTMSKQPHPFMCASGDTLNLLHIHTTKLAACMGAIARADLWGEVLEWSGMDGLKV